jgi:uncharacterized membrane protein
MTLLVSLAVTAVLFAAALAAMHRLPAGARIPMHWGLSGKVDGYGRPAGLLLVPCMTLGFSLLFHFLPLLEPRRGNLLRSSRAYHTVWLALVLFFAGVEAVLIGAAFGRPIPTARWVGAGLGALFLVMGLVFGNLRSNFFIGIRTPWTLSSELSWRRTHRLGGWMLVVFGVALLGAAVAGAPVRWLPMGLVGFWAVFLVAVLVYSYRVWRSDPDKAQLGRQ